MSSHKMDDQNVIAKGKKGKTKSVVRINEGRDRDSRQSVMFVGAGEESSTVATPLPSALKRMESQSMQSSRSQTLLSKRSTLTSLIDSVEHEAEEEEEEEEDDDYAYADVRKRYELTEDVYNDLKEAFQLFDVKRQGFLCARSLYHGLTKIGYNPTEAEAQDLAIVVAQNDTGQIPFDKFTDVMLSAWDSEFSKDVTQEVFCLLDRDENKILSVDDVAPYTARFGLSLSKEQMQKIILSADLDRDGMVTLKDLYELLSIKDNEDEEITDSQGSHQ